jgi:hypothetical protein
VIYNDGEVMADAEEIAEDADITILMIGDVAGKPGTRTATGTRKIPTETSKARRTKSPISTCRRSTAPTNNS